MRELVVFAVAMAAAGCGAGVAEVTAARDVRYRASFEDIRGVAHAVLMDRFPGRWQESDDHTHMVSCGVHSDIGTDSRIQSSTGSGVGGAKPSNATHTTAENAVCIEVVIGGAGDTWKVAVQSHSEGFQLSLHVGGEEIRARTDWHPPAWVAHKVSEVQLAIQDELKDKRVADR
jgi:hypothetical protein